jgi:hypothetical protein
VRRPVKTGLWKQAARLPTPSEQEAPANRAHAMTRYKVLVDDNFHFMDEEERFEHGLFPTAEEAISACRCIVDQDLDHLNKPGMTAQKLYQLYIAFGPDPFVVAVNPNDLAIDFSAWDYAKERSQLLVVDKKSERAPADDLPATGFLQSAGDQS